MSRKAMYIFFLTATYLLAIFALNSKSDYAQTPNPIGGHENSLEYAGSALWNSINDIEIQDHVAFCSMPFGIMIYDISDPQYPEMINKIKTDSLPFGKIEIQDTLLYAINNSSILIYNIGDYFRPKLVSEINLPYTPREISIDDYKLCITNWLLTEFSQMQIIDVSDPFHPILKGHFDFNYGITNLRVLNDTAYVTNHYDLWLIDINNPDSPKEIGHIETPECANDVTVEGDYIYIADGSCMTPCLNSWLLVINKSDPISMFIEDSIRIMGACTNIKSDNKYVYINAGMSGLLIYDIEQPNNPVLVGCCYTQGRSGIFDIDNDIVLLFDDVDWIQEEGPVYMCDSNGAYGNNNATPPMGSKPGDLLLVDISNKTYPQLISIISLPSLVNSVAISDSIAYVAYGGSEWLPTPGGIAVVNISSPDSIYCIFDLQLPYRGLGDMAISGVHLFATDCYDGLIVANIENSDNIFIESEIDLPWFTTGITIHGNLAFVSSYDLYIFDISKPEEPNLIACYHGPDALLRTAVRNDFVLIAARFAGMIVLDISVPSDPRFVTSYSYMGGPALYNDLVIQGDFVYLTGGSGEFEIVNISDPANPTFAGLYSGSGESQDIEVSGDYVYLTNSTDGISAIDISDTSDLYRAATYNTPGYAWDIAISGNSLLVADFYGLIRLNNQLPTGLEDEDESILPESVTLHQNYPNPFNPSTTIAFEIPYRSHVTLTIHNILGQEVARLIDKELTVGAYSVKWDGRDNSNAPVASGLYLYRLAAGDVVHSRKMILLK